MKTILLSLAGSLFLVLGVAGLLLPFMPGVLFLLVAALCFASASPALHNFLSRHPRLQQFFHRIDAGAGLDLKSRFKLAFWAGLEAANPRQKPYWQRRTNNR